MAEKKLYKEDSIQTLSPRDHVRLRPGMYVGSTEDATHLLVEIVANAIDEWKIGNCTKIHITIDDDTCIVSDNGQGFVYKMREDGMSILEASFSAMNTSGKYTDDGVYEGTSLGLNGVGSKATNFLSEKCRVSSNRDGFVETIYFFDGIFDRRETCTASKDCHGTVVEWKPDRLIFNDTHVNIEKVKKILNTFSCLCKGLRIELKLGYTAEPIIYQSERGLQDLIDKEVKKELIDNRFAILSQKDKSSFDMVLTYGQDYGTKMLAYVNMGETESGPHITQLKSVITREFNKFFREKKWLKEKEENLSGSDLSEGMIIAFNYSTTGVAYDAQTKTRVSKIDTTLITDTINTYFHTWMEDSEKDIKKIFDKAYQARKARNAAKRAREAVRKPKEKGLKAKMQLSDKFIDCTSKKSSERNLLLLEGVSAASAALEARNPKTDAIYLLKGKILSVLKQDIEKVLKNQELSDIIKIIGAGFDNNFDSDKMNFNKIVITSDSDSDGFNIELLLITFFFTYMRELVLDGKLYRAMIPLFIVKKGKEEHFFFTQEEYDEWYGETNGIGYEITRLKGVGETNASTLHEVCFKNQNFKRITVSDCKQAEELLELLQGKKVEPRKEYIYQHASKFGEGND